MRKRLFDIVVSAMLLVFLSPFLVLIAIAIRLTSEGSAIFRQERLGLHKKPFIIWKFRTMCQDAGMAAVTMGNDPRITPVGRFLRSTHLDELPQLWNVLRGEMSLVGPRPNIAPSTIANLVRDYDKRYQVKPGITGLAQADGRVFTVASRKAYARKNIIYAEKQSFLLDLRILFCTVPAIFHRRGI